MVEMKAQYDRLMKEQKDALEKGNNERVAALQAQINSLRSQVGQKKKGVYSSAVTETRPLSSYL